MPKLISVSIVGMGVFLERIKLCGHARGEGSEGEIFKLVLSLLFSVNIFIRFSEFMERSKYFKRNGKFKYGWVVNNM
jgi:hypothetical protein